LEEGYDPASIRHLLLSAHYRSDLNFTREGLRASANAVQRLLDFVARVQSVPTDDSAEAGDLAEAAEEATASFRAALDDDFNTPDAFGALFRLVSRVNAGIDERGSIRPSEQLAVLSALSSMEEVLGILAVANRSRAVDDDVASWVERRIEERTAARAARDFATADEIRDELAERGIVLEDGADGTRWKVVG